MQSSRTTSPRCRSSCGLPSSPTRGGCTGPRTTPPSKARCGTWPNVGLDDSEKGRASGARPSSSGSAAPLVPPAPEAGVGLPERRGALVVGRLVDVLAGRLDELLLGRSGGDELRPRPQLPPRLGEVVLDVVEEPEVDERQAPGAAAPDLVERPLPRVDIHVRRRRDRPDLAVGRDTHAGRVAGVERPVRVDVADVVRGVAGRREAVEPEHALAGDVDVAPRDGGELAP